MQCIGVTCKGFLVEVPCWSQMEMSQLMDHRGRHEDRYELRILKADSTKDSDHDHVKVWLMSMVMTTQRRCILASRMLETRPSRLVGASSFLVKWWLLGALPWRIFSETLPGIRKPMTTTPRWWLLVLLVLGSSSWKVTVSRNSPFCQAFVYKFVEANAFASSPLKMDGWKIKSPDVLFWGVNCQFQGGSFATIQRSNQPSQGHSSRSW